MCAPSGLQLPRPSPRDLTVHSTPSPGLCKASPEPCEMGIDISSLSDHGTKAQNQEGAITLPGPSGGSLPGHTGSPLGLHMRVLRQGTGVGGVLHKILKNSLGLKEPWGLISTLYRRAPMGPNHLQSTWMCSTQASNCCPGTMAAHPPQGHP